MWVLGNLVAKGKTDVRAMHVGVPRSVEFLKRRKNCECPSGMNEKRSFGNEEVRAFGRRDAREESEIATYLDERMQTRSSMHGGQAW